MPTPAAPDASTGGGAPQLAGGAMPAGAMQLQPAGAPLSDGTIWHNWYDHGTRYGWESRGNPGYGLFEGVGAVDRGNGYVDVTSGEGSEFDHRKAWN